MTAAASASNILTGPLDRRLAKVTRTGLLCAYPRVSVWDGKGDADASASYRCAAPMPGRPPG